MANDKAIIPNELLKQEEDLRNMVDSKLVYALKNILLERVKVEVEMHKQLTEVERQFHAKLAEFDAKRSAIVKGEVKPTEAECEYQYRAPDAVPVDPPADQKGIPNFWLVIMRNLELFNGMLQFRDEPILDKLVDVRYELLSEPQGFKLEFEFDENDFFTNKVLTKEYYYGESYDPKMPLEYDGPYISYTRGCTINWKSPDKDVTKETVTKKVKSKTSNQTKNVTKERPCDSFFNFFNPPTTRIEDVEPAEGVELTDEQEELAQLLHADFEIGDTFRHNVVPRAVIYYTGEGIQDDDFDEELGEFDEDDFDEFDEDDDEDDDDEEEEDDDVGGKGDKPKKHAGGISKKKDSRK